MVPTPEEEENLLNDSYSKSEDPNEIDTINAKRIEYQRQMSRAKALSMTFMKSFSGLCCDGDCDHDPLKLVEAEFRSHNEEYKSIEDNLSHHNSNDTGNLILGEASAVSALVVGPMMAKNLDYLQPGTIETMVGEYMCFCRFYNVRYNSGILTALRFSSSSIRPSGAFHDSDMLALVELLLRHANGALKHIKRLDFSIAGREGRHELNKKLIGFTSHGALSLAKALQTTKYIRQVFLPRNRIGPYGASAIFMACQSNPSIEDLDLKRCQIGKQGALAFCELILLRMNPSLPYSEGIDHDRLAGDGTRGLINVNLSLNHIGHQGTTAIERLLKERYPHNEIVVNLDGNLVFPEVSNALVDLEHGTRRFTIKFILTHIVLHFHAEITYLFALSNEYSDYEFRYSLCWSTIEYPRWAFTVIRSQKYKSHASHELCRLYRELIVVVHEFNTFSLLLRNGQHAPRIPCHG